MKIERVINVFDKESEKLVYDINVDGIKLEVLRKIFKPETADWRMYLHYDICEKEAEALKSHLDLVFDFDRYDYQLACYSA